MDKFVLLIPEVFGQISLQSSNLQVEHLAPQISHFDQASLN